MLSGLRPVSTRTVAKRFAIVLSFLALFAAFGPTTAEAITRDDAITIVETTIIDTSIYKAELDGYAVSFPLAPGAVLTQNLVDTVAVVADSAWFVWLDYKPSKKFAHDTEFILVNVQTGAIDLCFRGDLWPGIDTTLFYLEDRATTPDLFWTNGTSFPKNGKRPMLPDIVPRDYRQGWRLGPIDPAWKTTSTDVWGMIICPYDSSSEKFFRPDIECAKELFDSLGVPEDSIKVVYKKNRAQTLAALDAIPNGCDKLYVYWTGHGRPDSLQIPGGSAITAKEFACKLKDQGAKEYCVIIDACLLGEHSRRTRRQGGQRVPRLLDLGHRVVHSDAGEPLPGFSLLDEALGLSARRRPYDRRLRVGRLRGAARGRLSPREPRLQHVEGNLGRQVQERRSRAGFLRARLRIGRGR